LNYNKKNNERVLASKYVFLTQPQGGQSPRGGDSPPNMNESIFWVDVYKIKPNPYQPRKEFDENKLKELGESIRQYGVLQPLLVTRKEIEKDDGGIATEYELIAGERRLRASRLAGVEQVPVIIRTGSDEENAQLKLELALIENIQREDLNVIDRARAFKQLIDEFNFKHAQISARIGKSREYITNSVRILSLPEEMLNALSEKKINEGHTRPLLMLVDKPQEQNTLFKEIMYKKLNVREAERIARHAAAERARKITPELDPKMLAIERSLTEGLGTRVQIERKAQGGKVTIDFFDESDLRILLNKLEAMEKSVPENPTTNPFEDTIKNEVVEMNELNDKSDEDVELSPTEGDIQEETKSPELELNKEEEENDDADLYSIRNFTI
jgi:ParB family transcriptional regulator, chromosome partitioning protein